MSETVAKLLEQIRALPTEDRQRIADELRDDPELNEGDVTGEEMDALFEDPEFRAELERRIDEVEKHPERLIDGEQVLVEGRELLKRLKEQRSP